MQAPPSGDGIERTALRVLERQLDELATQLADYEGRLEGARAELRRLKQRLFEPAGPLVEALPDAGRTDLLEARRRAVHARARSAIAEL